MNITSRSYIFKKGKHNERTKIEFFFQSKETWLKTLKSFTKQVVKWCLSNGCLSLRVSLRVHLCCCFFLMNGCRLSEEVFIRCTRAVHTNGFVFTMNYKPGDPPPVWWIDTPEFAELWLAEMHLSMRSMWLSSAMEQRGGTCLSRLLWLVIGQEEGQVTPHSL